MRYVIIVLWSLIWSVTSAIAQVSIGIGLPSVSIGINLPVYPELVPVPGYPVYYAPRLSANFFFYDGMYWVYQQDNWYASSWYNGPWGMVSPHYVPYYVLRIPVSYYRQPPPYFRGWRPDAPPRWGEHWGRDWEQRRSGWDRWDRKSAPAPAPLPDYQRKYSGDRYPRGEQQPALHNQNYRYQPRESVVQQHYKERAAQSSPAPSQRGQQREPQGKGASQEQSRGQGQDKGRKPQGKGASQEQSRGQGQDRDREPQGKGASQDQIRGQGQDKGREPQGKGASQEKGRGQGQDKAREPQAKGESQEQRRGQGQDRDRDREKG